MDILFDLHFSCPMAPAHSRLRSAATGELPSAGHATAEFHPPARPWSGRDWLFVLAVLAAVFLVYQPAWRAGFVWDDDTHVTPPELRSIGGLVRI
jgi:hypothetical protein